MLVHAPELKIKDGMLRVSARIQYDKALPRVPNVFWFEMPAAQEKYLTRRADTFVANMLQVAMIRNEPLYVRGTVSAQLVRGVAEYQRPVSAWGRHPFKQICFEPEAVVEVTEPRPPGVGLPFSGGVDSFFTLWSHLAPQETMPSRRITHGIFLCQPFLSDTRADNFAALPFRLSLALPSMIRGNLRSGRDGAILQLT